MSEFHVEVVQIGEVTKHPNADNLSIIMVHGGYPCIIRTGEFNTGDLAVYCPVDSICPIDNPKFAFLGSNNRIKAKRLRGVFSMGLLVKPEPGWILGQNVQNELGITKWEPKINVIGTMGDQIPDPGFMPVYGIEGYRKYKNVLTDGEEVCLTEKIHGCSFRTIYKNDKFWVGSHRTYRKLGGESVWEKVAISHNLEEKLKQFPNIAVYGEVYGLVQDLTYGANQENPLMLRVFDVLDTTTRRWFDYDEMVEFCNKLDLPVVPLLYRGPWSKDLEKLAEGNSVIHPSQIKEGWVCKPVKERTDPTLGRVILKLVGEQYLLRKEK